MSDNSIYRLCRGIQVRSEKFGLLFYDYKGPKIYFVRSKDLVDESFFSGKQTFENLVRAVGKRRGWSQLFAQRQLSRFMQQLKSKGLVYEQPVC